MLILSFVLTNGGLEIIAVIHFVHKRKAVPEEIKTSVYEQLEKISQQFVFEEKNAIEKEVQDTKEIVVHADKGEEEKAGENDIEK